MKTKINILSPGRFHVLDLARELDKNGYDVKFYSFVPTKRAMRFGLPKHCSASIFVLMLPFLALCRIFNRSQQIKRLRINVQDYITAWIMRKSDVVIAMSGDFVYAPRRAKKKGALVIYERGSKHILEQKRVMESIPSNKGVKPIPDVNVKRELESYVIADYIAIASKHVYESFMIHNYPKEKLFVNPYGVELSDFYPDMTRQRNYDVIMIGGWSYRKGCDLIIEAINRTGYSFLHVGGLVDMEFPKMPNFTHHGIVDQKELINYYHQAKVFVLPSREEGLAMVQAQAVACNLPVVGSKDSGAEDLKRFVEQPDNIIIVEEFTAEAVVHALHEAMEQYDKLGLTIYAGTAKEQLTWSSYGKRYTDFLKKILKHENTLNRPDGRVE